MSTNDHNRIPPRERLSGELQHVDLAEAVAQLRSEPLPASSGHRQLAIVRQGPLSLVLFVFARDGALKEHRTNGVVTIHVLNGELEVEVGGESTVMGRGELLSLSPGLLHSVHAKVESEMLLCVVRAPSE